jgi:phenylpyruvate tautomerase PptA (4-oxalocrotonate tautomerase family)
MPNYTVHLQTAQSTETARADLARRIAVTHAAATAAPPSFAQVIISPVAGEHFIGGEPVDPRAVFVHGHIRAGRSTEAKDRLVLAVRDAVRDTLGVPEDLVWVYVSELPAAQMVEFGQVLPVPGSEAVWQAALPDDLRDRLARLDAAAADGA